MAALTVEEWFLLGLLGVSIVLACLGAAMFYGKRPIYPSTMTVRQRARLEQAARYYESRHRAEVADETQRLMDYPLRPDGRQ